MAEPMQQDPLAPSPSLLCKIGSIAVHVDEMLSPDGHAFDRQVLSALLEDVEVCAWLSAMEAQALVPRMRSVR